MAAKVDSLSWLVTWLQNWISFGIIYFDLKENLFLWKIVDLRGFENNYCNVNCYNIILIFIYWNQLFV